ncbi:MAG: hypothetical protein H7Z37_16945 [Pyrinomonadaceae bacterium]|nr:hypothetical protein [Pyrinomonadaceae bacterium]
MKRKLNLVLREPVKLHENSNFAPNLPSPFESLKEAQVEEKETVSEGNVLVAAKTQIKAEEQKKPIKTTSKSVAKSTRNSTQNEVNLRDLMTLRTQQIWDYLCEIAGSGEKVSKSLTITRAQIMREAGIGSTNTYRDAIQKFQDLGLIEIELRPGVNAGSTFHITKKGIEQIEIKKD